MINDIQISDNFWLYEFHSPDTKEAKLDPQLVSNLQTLRNLINERVKCRGEVPLSVTSGYRTPEYNRKVGGVDDSYHKKGMAADIRCPRQLTIDEFAQLGEEVGFNGIGKYYKQDFVHFDVRNYFARWDDN